ncbi:unnamed protein product [Chrysoparadoxa australica]
MGLEELVAAIEKKGAEIRDLKTQKAAKEEITKEVAALLDLKKQYQDANGGVAYVAPGQAKPAKKPKAAPAERTSAAQAPNREGPSKKERNKALRKEKAKEAKAKAGAGAGDGPAASKGNEQASSTGAVSSRPLSLLPCHPSIALLQATVLFHSSCLPVVAHTCASFCKHSISFTPVAVGAVPCLSLASGHAISGDHAIARYIARQNKNTQLLGGDSADTSSQVDQWLDLCLSHDAAAVANALEAHLALRTYVAGFALTLGDVAAFLKLEGSGCQVGPHVTRWMATVRRSSEVSAKGPSCSVGSSSKLASNPKPASNSKAAPNARAADKMQECPHLDGAEDGKVVTRFPPEPSGYLHIGHAKACLLNEYYARRYNGRLIVRFDDTNPSKEKGEYEESIIADLATLGVTPDTVTHTSDSFDLIHSYAIKLIEMGLGFMDDTPQEQMQQERMDRVCSQRRDATIAENLALFKKICDGEAEFAGWCLRAKLDMQSPNGCLRDPVIYRMNLTPHHSTGTKYKAYPTYDFACPIVDSHEGVTHALRTTEYDDRMPQYQWFLEKLELRKVMIHTFGRLNFVRTVLSKRKLNWFVDEGRVEGWFDPRFPTVQGVIRRGVSVAALRNFIYSQGASKRIVNMEWDKFWSLNKKQYEPTAHRYMGVAKDNCVVMKMSDMADKGVSAISVPLHPKEPSLGTRAMRVGPSILLEGDDAASLEDGEEVTLMRWGNAVVEKVVRDSAGKVLEVQGHTNLSGDVKLTKKKLTYLCESQDMVEAKLLEYDYLITKDKLDEGEDFKDFLTSPTKAETPALVDPGLRNAKHGEVVQLERRGFFRVDKPYGGPSQPIHLILLPDGRVNAMSTLNRAF